MQNIFASVLFYTDLYVRTVHSPLIAASMLP